jgi:hypothetical protein
MLVFATSATLFAARQSADDARQHAQRGGLYTGRWPERDQETLEPYIV